jgi:ABC-type lipoprotein export system ATPase subunit
LATSKIYAPDLTLSREPFGNLGSKKKAEGYLVFEVPIKQNFTSFIIADHEFSLQP